MLEIIASLWRENPSRDLKTEQMAFQQTFKQFHQFYLRLADRHSQNLKESNNLKALGAS